MTDAIELVIKAGPQDIGRFAVVRALTFANRRTVGSFISLDRMGPAEFPPGKSIDVRLDPRETLRVTNQRPEPAIYVVGDDSEIELAEGTDIEVSALRDARILLLGGELVDGEHHIWCNFVSSSKERIKPAKADWKEARFGKIAGDDKFVPLPEK